MLAGAVRFYVESTEEFAAAVDEGFADHDSGRSMSHEELVAHLRRRRDRAS